MGHMVEVEILSAGKHFLKAEVLADKTARRPEMVPPPLVQGEVSGVETLTETLTAHVCITCLGFTTDIRSNQTLGTFCSNFARQYEYDECTVNKCTSFPWNKFSNF